MRVQWVSAFLDFPAASFDDGVAFWSGVTGWGLSPARGSEAEFVSFQPPSGDVTLKAQRVGSRESHVHVDLHGDLNGDLSGDLRGGEESLGRRSPGGFLHCHVAHPASVRPPVSDWGTHASAVDQVCLDIPADAYDDECAFWEAQLGGFSWAPTGDPDYRRLQPPPALPWRFLLQRRLAGAGPVTAHLDLATTSRELETARHVSLGAQVREVFDEWTVLVDPTGLVYCVTDRSP